MDYFQRVHRQSPTRFWINNPSHEEAARALEAGAFACTTNPTFAMKMHKNPAEREGVEKAVRQALSSFSDDAAAAAMVQRILVASIAKAFRPLYESSGGRAGLVSVQISPYEEEDPEVVIQDARENRKLAPNIIAKIPTTEAGLAAMRVLMGENVPIIATEIMGLAQAVSVCELHREVLVSSSVDAPLYVTHIPGIFDDYLRQVVTTTGAPVDSDLLFQAGCALARRQYALMKARRYYGTLLCGGARGLHHFTEMVGGDVHVTINWKGGAEDLLLQNPPVVWRMDNPVPDYVIQGLSTALPDFRRAYEEDGLRPKEYAGFGPVVLFREIFMQGWDYLLDLVKTRRKGNGN